MEQEDEEEADGEEVVIEPVTIKADEPVESVAESSVVKDEL